MERVSGWYRRKVQFLLFVIATIVVCLLNADTLTTGRVLWRDDASRAAIVVEAEAAAQGEAGDIDGRRGGERSRRPARLGSLVR